MIVIGISGKMGSGKDSTCQILRKLGYPILRVALADFLKDEIYEALLEKEGFLKSVSKKGKKVVKSIEADLVYETDGAPKVRGVDRVSKLSKRVYQKAKELRPVKQGTGMLVLTTPKGIMTGFQARKEKVGGEILFKIW